MLLYYILITCVSFIFVSKSLSLKKPLPPWTSNLRFPTFFAWRGWCLLTFLGFVKKRFLKAWWTTWSRITHSGAANTMNRDTVLIPDTKGEVFGVEEEKGRVLSVLDLPELALECILEKLPPQGLCSMAGVCSSLRGRCVSDHLWERHMKERWGRILGPAAYRKWKEQVASRKVLGESKKGNLKGFAWLVSMFWPRSSTCHWIRTVVDKNNTSLRNPAAPVLPAGDSIMSCYVALETGRFCFPAQVYNRENGHVGFMLSCYDADVSYDPDTKTFKARYPPHGRRAEAIESGVSWDRLRAAPVDISSNELYLSDSLNDLRPGDQIEIQWRRNKEFPYGWWYGVVGHFESCDGEESHCWCHRSDTVVLEFRQYTTDSRWRRTTICRRSHREEGNEADGFYGGIRKLSTSEEISRWMQLWPPQVLE